MSVALVADPQPLSSEWQSFLLTAAVERSADVVEARNYHDGIHPNALTANQKTALAGLLGGTVDDDTGEDDGNDPPVDNQCKRIVEARRGRLSVRRLECVDPDVQAAADRFWRRNDLAAQQHTLHTWALIDGDAYVVLDWDNGRRRTIATVHRQWVSDEAATSPLSTAAQYRSRTSPLWLPATALPTPPGSAVTGDGVHVVYDSMGLPEVAIKEWTERTWDRTNNRQAIVRRRNFYFRDRIERYALLGKDGAPSAGGAWQPYPLAGEPWPVRWVHPRTREPLGIPVVHFVHDQGPDHYGRSVIDRVIRGEQRAVNDIFHALIAHMRMRGYGMLAVTGIPAADVAEWRIAPGQILGSEKPEGKIVTIAAADMEGNIRVLRFVKELMMNNASVPTPIVTGDWPSGEAIIQVTLPLISVSQVAQEFFGLSWASAAHKDTNYRNAWGGDELDTEVEITPAWDDAILRDRQYRLATIGQQPWLSVQEKMRQDGGWTEDEIKRNIKELAEERQMGLSGTAAQVRLSEGSRDDASGGTEEAA